MLAKWLAKHTLVYDVHPVIAARGWKAITLAGDELAFRAVLGICRSGAVPLSGCYYHFLLPNVSDVRAVRFAAMSHKVQLSPNGRARVTPAPNRRMLRIEWEETMAQAQSYREFQDR